VIAVYACVNEHAEEVLKVCQGHAERRHSRSGPVLLLSGFPPGTAIRFISTGAGQSCTNYSAVTYWNHTFPSGGKQFSPGTTICIAGSSGQVVLQTVQDQSTGQIGVLVNWSGDLVNVLGPNERLQYPPTVRAGNCREPLDRRREPVPSAKDRPADWADEHRIWITDQLTLQ
jgi:hypothetical protein